jgi:histidinol-phosphate aminotransferase
MNPFWSQIARELSPYVPVPGEQPRIAHLVKLNTNESPFGPSPLALEAMRSAAADTLRLYPDPEATELREALAGRHGVKPEQVFSRADRGAAPCERQLQFLPARPRCPGGRDGFGS